MFKTGGSIVGGSGLSRTGPKVANRLPSLCIEYRPLFSPMIDRNSGFRRKLRCLRIGVEE